MSEATERTKQSEEDYKKIFKTRLDERREEQDKQNVINRESQAVGMKKALRRKIAIRRSK